MTARCPECNTNNVSSWVYTPEEGDSAYSKQPHLVIECNECREQYEERIDGQ